MRVTWQSRNYAAESVRGRYVRFDKGEGAFHFCETGIGTANDIRQGTVEESELPAAIAERAKAAAYGWPSYVAWPIERSAHA